MCFICASHVSHYSVAPCNHRTCHICALRLRALYKTKACAHCRTEAATVIFTVEPEKRYDEYKESDYFRTDTNLGIAYEKPEIFEDTVLLLRYNCPDSNCDVACMGWPDLHRHVRSVHHKIMCDLCTRNKKVFTHEHELFTQHELRKHEKYGDDNPGAVDQSGFKGHPECGFCRQRFYGDEELYVHCRDRHERCHICDRRTGGNKPQYYVDYNALEHHFTQDHHPCLDQECMEKKFVVFESAIDLKAHQIEQHPNGLTKGRIDRRVDLSNFDYRPQYQEDRSRRGGRHGGPGRNPDADVPLPMTAAHLSRAEVAHQREREIHSAQNVSSRTFGGRLTQPEPSSHILQRPRQSPGPAIAQPSFPSTLGQTANGVPSSPKPAEALTPQEQARRVRHAAVIERAATLLQNDAVKLDEFRERISSYRKSAIVAGDLIDAFFALFDTSSAELGKLIKELADIFEVPGKRDELLKAWSDWKAINEDYPSLPGPAGVMPSTAAGVLGQSVGTKRVLKLKSSTAQSGRSVNATPKSWGASASSSGSAGRNGPGSAFPSLPLSRPNDNATSVPSPAWLAVRPTAAPASHSSSAGVAPAPLRSHSLTSLPKGAEAFPALPAAKKPTSTVFSPGYTGSGVIRNHSSTPVNAWGAGVATTSNPSSPPLVADSDGGKGKGRKGKKQIVFQWG